MPPPAFEQVPEPGFFIALFGEAFAVAQFFRDIAGSRYLAIGETVAKEMGLRYDMVLNVFDRSIIEVENRVYADAMGSNLMRALERTFKGMPQTAGRAGAIRDAFRIGGIAFEDKHVGRDEFRHSPRIRD
jgi:hypothetical protein